MSRLLYFLIAILLAAIAQRWLVTGDVPRDSLWLFVVAGVIFAAASLKPPAWPVLPPRRQWKRVGLGFAVVAVIMAVVATIQFWSGKYDGWAFWLWLAAIPLFLLGVWLDGPSADPEAEKQAAQAWQSPRLDRRLVLLILLLILVVAVGVRFYALDAYPNGLQSDEGNNGLDALKWLSGAPYIPYAETNEGQATLFTYIIAWFISIFGQSVQTLRMVSATVGVITVLAFYFLAKELYDQRVALLTTALLAADRWHITFSRIVYELILMPLVLSLQVLFLFKALKSGRRRWWALSGIMLALGMNTYTAYRVVPLFVALYFIYWLIAHRQRIRQDFEGMLVFGLGAAVAVAPLGAYTIRNWSIFLSRINHISVFRDVEAAGSYQPLWSNFWKTLYMFNWQGDIAALNNLPGAPLLQAIMALLLVLGIAWSIRWFWKELPLFYLLWFVAVASVAVLSVAHEAPTARRPIGLIPVIYLLVAAVFAQIWQAWEGAWGEKRWKPLAVGLSVIVVFVMLSNINTYFRVQAVDSSVQNAYSPSESAVGKYLTTVPEDELIFMTPQYTHHSAMKFIGGPHDIVPFNLTQHIPLRDDPGRDVIFLLETVDDRLIPLLQQLYPGGEFQAHQDDFGRSLFLTYRIPRMAYQAARGLRAAYIPDDDPDQPPVRGEQVSQLDIDFSAQQPLVPPFVARYDSALLAPQFGDYVFELTALGGEGRLLLDGEEVLRVLDGSQQVERTLAGGFQDLRVVYRAGGAPGPLQLRWSTPQNAELSIIPPEAYYSLAGAANGLVGYYYDTPDWSGTPLLIQRDLFILPNNVLREPYSIRWVGKIAAPSSGRYLFGTRSDDGSILFINGQQVVDNGGSHGSEYREGVIDLSEGFHDIEVLYNELGGSRQMQLWWQPPGGGKSIVPSAYLYPVEDALPQGLELPPPPVEPSRPTDIPLSDQEPAPTEQGQQFVGEPSTDFPIVQPAVLWTYGSCGSGDEQLLKPAGVTVDDNGYVYVADAGNNRIVRIDPEGEYDSQWGEAGDGPGQFSEVFDLDVTPAGEIVALDAAKQLLSKWTPEGEFVEEFGVELRTYHPRGFGLSTFGDYFIADTGGARVLQVGSDGSQIRQFGGGGDELGAGQPTDVAVGADGMLYVVEPIGRTLWRVDSITDSQERYPGPEANTVESPHLAAGDNGLIYLTDPEKGRVLVYSGNMQSMAQLGGKGTEPGLFSRTLGIAVGVDGSIIVSDPDLCRVTMFSGLP